MNTPKKMISIMNALKKKTRYFGIYFSIILFLLSSCSLSPGMHMKTEASWLDNELSIFIPELNTNIDIENISNIKNNNLDYNYKIGKGDQVSITVWGLPDIFPISNITPDQNLRRVDSNGNIFFPYVGIVKAEGLTQDIFVKI